ELCGSLKGQHSLGVDEFGNKLACRTLLKIDERTLLNDPAFIHQHDFVAEVGGFGEIVRDKKRGLSQAREDFLQVFLERRTHERIRSEEHTSELQSRGQLVCRLLL